MVAGQRDRTCGVMKCHRYNMPMNRRWWISGCLLLVASVVQAQAPVEDRSRALSQGQYRAGMAYRTLEQARYEAKLAEQDALNAEDAHKAAQQQAELRKRELDAARQALTAARARLTDAQKNYEREVDAVNAVPRPAPGPGRRD